MMSTEGACKYKDNMCKKIVKRTFGQSGNSTMAGCRDDVRTPNVFELFYYIIHGPLQHNVLAQFNGSVDQPVSPEGLLHRENCKVFWLASE